jgi:hypothetical protein
MPDISSFFAFYVPGSGFNINLIIGWLIALAFGKRLFHKGGDLISDALLKLLNKIPALASSEFDELLVGKIEEVLSEAVLASMQEAQEIKEDYTTRITAAMKEKDNEKVLALSKEMREKLEALTKGAVDGFFEGAEKNLMAFAISKLGNKAKAAEWIYKKVKALVEKFKDPDRPSAGTIIVGHTLETLENLGNELSTERGSND